MKEQMKAAGIVSADEKLATIADGIAAHYPKDRAAAENVLWMAIEFEPALLLAIFAPFKKEAARRVLQAAYDRIRAGQKEPETHRGVARTGSGQIGGDTHLASAAPLNSDAKTETPQGQAVCASDTARDGQMSHDNHCAHAVPRHPVVTDSMKRVVKESLLDTFRVTTRQGSRLPIGDVYIASVNTYAQRMGRHAWVNARERELMLMIGAAAKQQAHVPADAKVRDVFTAEQIAMFIEQAGGIAKHPDLGGFYETLKEEANA